MVRLREPMLEMLNRCLDDLRPSIIAHQLKLLKEFPWQKDGSSIVYHCLLEYLRVGELIQLNPQLASSCLAAMNDRGLASEVRFCLSVRLSADARSIVSGQSSLLRSLSKTFRRRKEFSTVETNLVRTGHRRLGPFQRAASSADCRGSFPSLDSLLVATRFSSPLLPVHSAEVVEESRRRVSRVEIADEFVRPSRKSP